MRQTHNFSSNVQTFPKYSHQIYYVEYVNRNIEVDISLIFIRISFLWMTKINVNSNSMAVIFLFFCAFESNNALNMWFYRAQQVRENFCNYWKNEYNDDEIEEDMRIKCTFVRIESICTSPSGDTEFEFYYDEMTCDVKCADALALWDMLHMLHIFCTIFIHLCALSYCFLTLYLSLSLSHGCAAFHRHLANTAQSF